MIDLYTYRTSNGRKVSIMLEECGLPYTLRVVDITKGDQHAPEFLKISPNGRIPAIVDRDGPEGRPLALFESGAILLYLAEKTGRFLSREPEARWQAMQWLMWQMGGVGPNFGQAFHFLHQFPEGTPDEALAYGRDRFVGEVRRLLGVMESRLRDVPWLGGADYGIADMATFPWVALHGWLGVALDDWPSVARWHGEIRERPAVRRGMDVPTRAEAGM